MKKHSVTITVNQEGKFSYDNPMIWVDAGDSVTWKSPKNPIFAVHLGWDSPLDKGRYHSSTGEIKASVLDSAQPGYFRYSVAVFDGKNIWTGDPEIIVKRPPRE